MKKNIKFHGMAAIDSSAPAECNKKQRVFKQNSSQQNSVSGIKYNKSIEKKLLGPEKQPLKIAVKTYKATEVFLDVYKKLSWLTYSCTGFRAPGRTGVEIPLVPLSVRALTPVGNPTDARSPIVSSPALSPDGKYAFVGSHNHNLYCLSISDKGQLNKVAKYDTKEIISSSNPIFTLDGTHIIAGAGVF